MSDLIPSSVLLAIIQNQIKNAVDTSKFHIYKTIGDASALTEEEKNDISKNVYLFLIDSSNSLYVLDTHYAEDDWSYYNYSYGHTFISDTDGFTRIDFRKDYGVFSDINGDVYSTEVIIDAAENVYASSKEVTLKSKKYPDVTFYANYFTDKPSPIYRFSSGIILDSSTGTPQYKIVLATYDVNADKVTFVEKVLP